MKSKDVNDSKKITNADNHKFSLASVIYYYVAMLISLLVFFGGANLATHGVLRATSPNMAANATCLPPPAPKVTDPASVSAAELRCRAAERNNQIRQGTFQFLQGFTMVVIAGFIFTWHFRRVRWLELKYINY